MMPRRSTRTYCRIWCVIHLTIGQRCWGRQKFAALAAAHSRLLSTRLRQPLDLPGQTSRSKPWFSIPAGVTRPPTLISTSNADEPRCRPTTGQLDHFYRRRQLFLDLDVVGYDEDLAEA